VLLTSSKAFLAWLARYQLPVLLAGSAVVMVAVALIQQRRLRFPRFRKAIHVVARHRKCVQIGLPILFVALRLALLPIWKQPTPAFLDEFSFLLMADTFASGRLINPPHPLWQHFETIFVLSQPTYGSVYPVAAGAFMGIGEVFFHDPWYGVLLSWALMLAAMSWMFYAWLPPFWALWTSLWAGLQVGLFSYWMNSYWGGSVAALGGALVLGALPRLKHDLHEKQALIFALGLCLLANSRPYEGLLTGAIASAYLMYWYFRQSLSDRNQLLRRLFVPVTVVLICCLSWMGYYFNRVTGSPLEMPYQSYAKQYAASPAFVWQPLPPEPVYRHLVLRDAHRSFIMEKEQFSNVPRALALVLWKLRKLATFYIGPVQVVLLFLLPCLLTGRARILVLTVLLVVFGIMLTVSMQVHYAAPVAGAIFVVAVQSIRILWSLRRRMQLFGFIAPALPAVLLLTLVVSRLSTPPQLDFHERADLSRQLQEQPGQHLVIVHYGPDHLSSKEWVYNRANIDASKTVWARDMGSEKNRELLDYYPDRKPWLLDADSDKPALSPYK
jgi:hypothetical protein